MKKTLLTYLLSLVALCTTAQVSFSWSIKNVGKDELLLIFNGHADEGWHVASQSITLETADGIEAVGAFADGKQRLRITKPAWHLRGYMEFMACSDVACLAPQRVEFERNGSADNDEKASAPTAQKVEKTDSISAENGGFIAQTDSTATAYIDLSNPLWQPVQPSENAGFNASDNNSGGVAFILFAFLAGLLALLTPCVWPIIPLTVSYFLKQGRGLRDAVLFGASIIGIFLALGLAVTVLFGANAMNQLATNAVFNIVCFVVLLLFGLSFIGLFNITLPASWSTRLDAEATKKGGFIGIFLMALTLVVVSFSCTAPIVGTLLVDIATRDTSLFMPLAGMLAFALALALPFTLFAMFPSWLKKMPRSGSWMHYIKVVLGVLEMAFALKFLSVADMAYGWGLLSQKTFLAIWALLFGALTLYIIMKTHSIRWWCVTGILPLALTAYLIRGIIGGDTRMVSAFLPPANGDEASTMVFHDYEEGMHQARISGRKVFVDFTGYGCVNCRKMEASVFTDERIKAKMAEYIVIRLHVDDRTALPQRLTVKGKPDRILRTVGDKWALLEEHKFGQQTQPLYAILNADGTLVKGTYSYDEDVEKFLEFIE